MDTHCRGGCQPPAADRYKNPTINGINPTFSPSTECNGNNYLAGS